MEVAEVKSQLTRVYDLYARLESLRLMVDKKISTKFSIFAPLKIDENPMSNLIAYLLNPKGHHAQGDIFLKEFLIAFGVCKRDEIIHLDLSDAILRREKPVRIPTSIHPRKLDIYIESKANKIYLGIENKHWAIDQHNQVSDYLKYGVNVENGGKLIYLSIDKDPADHSIGEYKKSDKLIITRYRNELISWLDECAKCSESERVRWAMLELKDMVLKKYYSEDSFMDNNKEIVDLLVKDKNVLQAYIAASKSYNGAVEILTYNFFKELAKRLKVECGDNWSIEAKKVNYNEANWEKKSPISVSTKEGTIAEVYFQFQGKKSLEDVIYGFTKKRIDGHLYEQIKPLVEEVLVQPGNEWWYKYDYIEGIKNFSDPDTAMALTELSQPPMSELIEKLVSNISTWTKEIDKIIEKK